MITVARSPRTKVVLKATIPTWRASHVDTADFYPHFYGSLFGGLSLARGLSLPRGLDILT